MFSIVNKLFGRRTAFVKYPDAFTLTSDASHRQLVEAIGRRIQAGDAIWLISHFPKTFSIMQNLLEEAGLDYEIVLRAVDAKAGRDMSSRASQVVLALSQSLQVDDGMRVDATEQARGVSVFVAERHLLPRHDRKIEDFFRVMALPVRMGYFLALDDFAVRAVIPATLVQLLRQIGMGPEDHISSSLVSKRLEISLSRLAKCVVRETECDSAEAWWAANVDEEAARRAGLQVRPQPSERELGKKNVFLDSRSTANQPPEELDDTD